MQVSNAAHDNCKSRQQHVGLNLVESTKGLFRHHPDMCHLVTLATPYSAPCSDHRQAAASRENDSTDARPKLESFRDAY
jgi:hypothetical protein